MVNRPAAVRGVAAAFLALSTIAVLLRCYVRLRIVKAFGWDDGIMILAMVCPLTDCAWIVRMLILQLFYIMYCGSMFGGGIWGTGRHLADLIPEHASIAMEVCSYPVFVFPIASL
jgi:hypothetical protein